MAYQTIFTDASGHLDSTAYSIANPIVIDTAAGTASATVQTWKDKASHDAGLAPTRSFTRTVPAVALANTVKTAVDNAVTGGLIPELIGSTVVA